MKKTILLIVLCITSSLQEANTKENPEPQLMIGFPPTPQSQVTFQNYRHYPQNKWSFNHISAVYNTAMIPRGKTVWQFNDNGQKLAQVEAEKLSTTFANNDADSLIVIKDGDVLFEQYWNYAASNKHHIWFSVTKSLVSTAFGVLVEQGVVNLQDSPAKYLPELKGSGFERVTIQNVLNHSTGIDFKENYTDQNSDFLRHYTPAMNMSYIPGGRDVKPDSTNVYGLYDFLAHFVKADNRVTPGEEFDYNSANADVIGWLISRLSGMPLNEFIAKHIWQKIGAEHDAYIAVDRAYMPVATGGMNTTLRDAAKFALMVMQNGKFNGEQVIAKAWLDKITQTSDKQKQKMRRNPKYQSAGWQAYNNMWWVLDSAKGEFVGSGIHGQVIYINRSKNVVAVYFSSQQVAASVNTPQYARKLSTLRELVKQL